jgi:MscS family membrane protein
MFHTVSLSVGTLVLTGLPALAVRLVLAVLILLAFVLLSRLADKKLFPKLLARRWPHAVVGILLRGFDKPVCVLVKALGLYFCLVSLPWSVAGLYALLASVLRMAITLCICWGLWESAPICRLALSASKIDPAQNKTLALMLGKIYKFLIALFGGLMIVEETGLPVTGILTGAGLAGLTISLAAQNSASNIFNGMLILLEHPFGIGDWITVNDVSGTVEDITFTATKIRALDNSLYVVPNSSVCSATINNATNRQKRLYRFTLGVTYDTTRAQIEQLMEDITALLRARTDVCQDSVTVRLTGFGSSSIDILVSAHIAVTDMGVFMGIQNELNLDLMDIMKRNGVSFAFPSTSVYLESTPESK